MSRPEKHPHLDMPTEEQLVEVLAETPDDLRQLYVEMHGSCSRRCRTCSTRSICRTA